MLGRLPAAALAAVVAAFPQLKQKGPREGFELILPVPREADTWEIQAKHYDLEGWLRATGQMTGHDPFLFHKDDRWREFLRTPTSGHPKNYTNLCMDGRLAPEFFLIGAQKASTTSFASELFTSPAVVHPRILADGSEAGFGVKELHIFDNPDRYNMGKKWWLSHYPPCTQSRRAIGIDMTPNYMISPVAAQRMLDRYGDQASRLKFMVLLRDPVKRMQSAFYHGKANHWCGGKFANITFSHHASAFVEDHNARGDSAWNDWIGRCTSLRASPYVQQLKLWFSKFSSDKFLIAPYQFQINRTLQPYGNYTLAQKVFGYLGISGQATPGAAEVNVQPHPALEDDLAPTIASSLRTAVYHYTGAKSVSTLLSNHKATLYGYKGPKGDINKISAWLQEHW